MGEIEGVSKGTEEGEREYLNGRLVSELFIF